MDITEFKALFSDKTNPLYDLFRTGAIDVDMDRSAIVIRSTSSKPVDTYRARKFMKWVNPIVHDKLGLHKFYTDTEAIGYIGNPLIKESKSSMQKKKEAFMHKKSEALDGATAKRALAKHLGVQSRAIKDSDDYEHLEPDYEFSVNVDGKTQVWGVYQDEDSAITAAVDDLESRFMDTFDGYIMLGHAIDHYGINYFLLNIVDCDEEQEDELRSLYDELSTEEFGQFVQRQVAPYMNVDYRKFAQHNIDDLGAAWHLAQYDGEEVELSNGLLAYRFE